MVGSIAYKSLLLLAVPTLAGVNYPTLPKDLTTPFQQRLAVFGANGTVSNLLIGMELIMDI